MKIADQLYHCQILSQESQVWRLQLNPTSLVWLECYAQIPNQSDDGEFSQVTFDWRNGQATNPQWQMIAPKVAQALISQDLLPA